MMWESVLAFIIWVLIGFVFIGLGIYDMCSKRATTFGFWVNVKPFPVVDVKGYNKALGKLWIGYGIVLILFGIPLLCGQNSAGIVITILGTVFATIAIIVIYVTVIEPKYRIK